MEPEKISWQQIVLPLGLMVAVFIFVGSGNSNVRTEAGVSDPLYQACKLGCSAQEMNEKYVCDNYPGIKCDIAKATTMTCKAWYDNVHCAQILSSSTSSFSGFSSGGFFSPQSADLNSRASYYDAMTQGVTPSANANAFYSTNPVSEVNNNFADYYSYAADQDNSEAADYRSPGVYSSIPSSGPYTGLAPATNPGASLLDTRGLNYAGGGSASCDQLACVNGDPSCEYFPVAPYCVHVCTGSIDIRDRRANCLYGCTVDFGEVFTDIMSGGLKASYACKYHK